MNPKLDRKAFCVCLVELTNTALYRNLLEEAAAVLTGLRVLRPNVADLDILEASILIKRGQRRESIQVLSKLESSPAMWSTAKSMIATCQFILNDPDWQISANEVLQRDDATPNAVETVRQLQRKDKGKAEIAEEAEAGPALSPLDFQHAGFSFYLRA